MSIGPNNSKPIFPSWEQTQQKIQPPFGNTLGKLSTTFRDFGQKVSPQSVALLGQNVTPPAVLGAQKKIPGLLSGKGR
jgi:hypothetical protein